MRNLLDTAQLGSLACLLSSGSENVTPAVSPLASMEPPAWNEAHLESTLASQYMQLMPMLETHLPAAPAPMSQAPQQQHSVARPSTQPAIGHATAEATSTDVEALQAAIVQASMIQAIQQGMTQQALQLLLATSAQPDPSTLLLSILANSASLPQAKADRRPAPPPKSQSTSVAAPSVPVLLPLPAKPASLNSEPLSDSEGVCAREKNRLAQRRFRERQRNLITTLKDQADAAEAKYEEALKQITLLREENTQLKARLDAAHTSNAGSYSHRSRAGALHPHTSDLARSYPSSDKPAREEPLVLGEPRAAKRARPGPAAGGSYRKLSEEVEELLSSDELSSPQHSMYSPGREWASGL